MKIPFNFFRKKKPTFLSPLYKYLGISPRDERLYIQAFTHASYEGDFTDKNERLEFLGDAVLGLVVSEILIKKYPLATEGWLTKAKSRVVNREKLNKIAAELNIATLLRHKMGKQFKEQDHDALGNALEALIGAIFKNYGYKKTYAIIVEKILNPYINWNELENEPRDFKSKLIELLQAKKMHFFFQTQPLAEQEEDRKFESILWVEQAVVGKGYGRSKKQAEQEASSQTLSERKDLFL
ncbi:MAG: ribonuclease III [Chitinophagales bacterium]|nr:ribonuclease III [Chitinophagales bacterium]